jgi:hypothetical protein
MMFHSEDKILTWHPEGKKGVYVAKKDYDLIVDFILSTLKANEITINDLIELGEVYLSDKIDKDISWHILVVKLDLEARGLIKTVLKSVPYRSQYLKLCPRALKKFRSLYIAHPLLHQP